MIDIKRHAGIAVLTLTHGKANALDIEFCEALTARFVELRGSDAKAVVLTGQGKIFSAGVDLIRLSEGGAAYIRKFLPALHKLYDAVFYHPKPVVAAINGHAIAGGCVLAACADRRIMANDGGRIGVTELLVGVPFPALAFEIMRHATPPYFFSETILSGATFPAEMAAHRGWVNEAVEPALVMERAIAAAQSLAALSPAAFAQTKMQIRQAVTERMAQSGKATDKAVTAIWTAPETLSYIRDYVARTLKKS
jgi:enoyl-CoA hydratase